jgi:TonB family protein
MNHVRTLRLVSVLLALASAARAHADSDAPPPASAAPAIDKAAYVAIPPVELEQRKLAGDAPHVPRDAANRAMLAKQAELVVTDMIYVDAQGHVTAVEPIAGSGDSAVDEAVASAVRGWRFPPQERPIRSAMRFVFAVPRFKNVPPRFLDERKLSGPIPHLPPAVRDAAAKSGVRELVGMYKMCVDLEGRVAPVLTIQSIGSAGDAAVQAALSAWKFPPNDIGICSLTRFIFQVR